MISAKDLTDEQRSAMEQWAQEGAQLADIQKRLQGQFGLNVTYMDTRFIVLDLGIELKAEETNSEEDEETAEVVPPEQGESPGGADVGAILDAVGNAAEGGAPGGVSVTTDELARPGAIVSGTVTFSDGEKAVWLIDQMGRPGLDPDTPGYQPTEEDLIEFEKHLREVLQG